MEKAVLNVKKLKVTQGMNGSYSHNGELAIDIGYDCEYFKAPFTGVIKRIYTKTNTVWLESLDKVKYADGTEDYMTVMTTHDNSVTSLYVGKVIKQGEIYYQPGVKGEATGSHIHLGVGKGKFTGNGWSRGKYQPKIKGYAYPINNQYDITKALFVHTDVKQTNPMYDWKETSDYIYNKPVSNTKYLNLKPEVSSWKVYKTNKYYNPKKDSDILMKVNPKKFNGLSYKIYEDMGNYHFKIKTVNNGYGYIAGNPNKYSCTITDKPTYKNGNY
ncbi:MAG: hypothetical protein IKL65_00330 [Bacilli bacterium]|nr:hypothetical protein [Bacilli bacterium]